MPPEQRSPLPAQIVRLLDQIDNELDVPADFRRGAEAMADAFLRKLGDESHLPDRS